ncbi:hypothetical protein BKA70DRAFT_1354823 [Coprinopsis sp. MPI-PUGE-AT-0042]|nr:hypothetical protein BKA70DRAFT_1354823 [Coprinopsis sp. MPI-PUGE-AT-0042]
MGPGYQGRRGLPSQQWRLESSDGVFWYIQNVASRRYLGLPIGEYVTNSPKIQEVDHKPVWHIERCQYKRNQFLLHVPYTEFVICLDSKVAQPGKTINIHDNDGSHRAWYLCKDLHLKTSSILRDGSTYKIIQNWTDSAITVKDDYTVSCSYNYEGERQMFKAVKTVHGWAFQNVKTKRYMGIPHTTVYPDDSLCLSCVTMEFPWIVVPHHEGDGQFTIWLPFTQTVLQSYNGSFSMEAGYSEHGLWKFEEISTPSHEERPASERVLGERRPGEE